MLKAACLRKRKGVASGSFQIDCNSPERKGEDSGILQLDARGEDKLAQRGALISICGRGEKGGPADPLLSVGKKEGKGSNLPLSLVLERRGEKGKGETLPDK